jgi:hypothetical protein
MKLRTSAALAGSAAALAAAGWLAAPALASSASTTLHFTAKPIASQKFTKVYGSEVDKDVSGGKVVSYNMLDFVSADSADVSLALKDGFLYGQFTINSAGAFSGKVTGGTGMYTGDTGTITGQAQQSGGAQVTVVYQH